MAKYRYRIIHDWLHKHHGKPNRCENHDCDGNGSRFEYALIHGFEHERNRSYYMMLCSKCHRNYDMTEEKSKTAAHHLAGKYNENLWRGPKSREKSVILIDENKTFDSIKELAEYLGCDKSSVSHVLNGRRKTVYGKMVRYAID